MDPDISQLLNKSWLLERQQEHIFTFITVPHGTQMRTIPKENTSNTVKMNLQLKK